MKEITKLRALAAVIEHVPRTQKAFSDAIVLLEDLIDDEIIGDWYGCTVGTVRRWRSRKSAPHPMAISSILERMPGYILEYITPHEV